MPTDFLLLLNANGFTLIRFYVNYLRFHAISLQNVRKFKKGYFNFVIFSFQYVLSRACLKFVRRFYVFGFFFRFQIRLYTFRFGVPDYFKIKNFQTASQAIFVLFYFLHYRSRKKDVIKT